MPDNENSLIFVATRGGTFFEISNHLGNVHLVLSDYRSITGDGSGTITGYHSSVSSASEYYPFGMLLVEGEYDSQSYRYGFNTQERDDEIYGSGNSYSAEFWQYDARLGRRWNVDPVNKFHESSYATFYNNPIIIIDPSGLDGDSATTNSNKKTTPDAGHRIDGTNNSKVDPGASDGDHLEKDYALIVEEQVDYWLGEFGVENQRTREGDISVNTNSINYRWRLANDNNSDVFVSIHLEGNDEEGMFILIDNRKNRQGGNPEALGMSILDNSLTLPTSARKVENRADDPKGRKLYIRFFNGDAAVIVELGGIGNEKTRKLILSNASDIGREIATGVYIYMHGESPPYPPECPWMTASQILDSQPPPAPPDASYNYVAPPLVVPPFERER